jgi:hypothetical protein
VHPEHGAVSSLHTLCETAAFARTFEYPASTVRRAQLLQCECLWARAPCAHCACWRLNAV